MPDGPPYTAGDEMTCSSDGYPAATYEWKVNDVADSTTSTQELQEGDNEYTCTAYLTYGRVACIATTTVTVGLTAYSKYQQEFNTVATMLMLTALSAVQAICRIFTAKSDYFRLQ